MDEDQETERFGMENNFEDSHLSGGEFRDTSSDDDEDEQRRERSTLSDKRTSELFEKYGIGMRILKKMGHKGGGLGKNEQGIVSPIEAKLLPKNMGIGFSHYKQRKNSSQEPSEKQPPVARMKEIVSPKLRAPAKKKKRYMTAEELLSTKQDPVLQKIIDMRGPQIRVLTNLGSLNAEDQVKECGVPLRELQHNIRLILDMTEIEIRELDRKLWNEREIAAALQQEKVRLQNQKQLSNMEEILEVLDRVNEANSSGTLALDSLAESFRDLRMRFADEYRIHNLPSIAYSYALPLFITTFQGWDPLQNPSHGRNLMVLWKNLLQKESSLYTQLVMQVVLPAVRISGINTWQARDPEPMLRFLEDWDELLPSAVRQSILDMVVMPKLSEAVDTWNLGRETIPIHAWIHPWWPLLHEKLESLYQAVVIKLGFALRAWHPSDSSAFTMLDPWKTVLDPRSWEHLVVRYILPKLCEVLDDFEVNPNFRFQKLDEFNWVMTWASALPIHHMVNLLELHFFSKWLRCLYRCLTQDPDFEEVSQWYLGWKDLLPLELTANEHVKIQLNIALNMMNQAVEGLKVTQPGLKEGVSNCKATAYAQKPPSMGSGGNEPEMSLIEVISAYAKEHNILFMPKPGMLYNSRQIHRFGNVGIIVDSLNETIYAKVGGELHIASLEQLLHLHKFSGYNS